MSVLEYSYQPSLNIDEVNRQVSALVDACKTALLDCASSQAVEEVSLKAEQNGEQAGRRIAEISARVNETSSKVNLLATYDTAQGTISVSAALVNGIAQSNIVLSGDHIILDGNVTIGSGFYLSGDHITALTIDASQITSGTIAAARIDASSISVQALVNNYGNTIVFGDGIKIPTSPGSSDYCTYINNSAIYTKQIMAERILCTKISQGSTPAQLFTSYLSSFSGEDLYIHGLTRVLDGLKVSDHLESFGTTYLNSTVYSHGIQTAAVQSGTANVKIDSSDKLMAISGSSKRFKHDIKPLEDKLDAHKLYDIPVIQFVYNEDYLDKDDLRYKTPIPGFIAEDIKEKYPIACDIDKEGQVETWNERIIIPPMLALIQEHNERLKRLEEKLDG